MLVCGGARVAAKRTQVQRSVTQCTSSLRTHKRRIISYKHKHTYAHKHATYIDTKLLLNFSRRLALCTASRRAQLWRAPLALNRVRATAVTQLVAARIAPSTTKHTHMWWLCERRGCAVHTVGRNRNWTDVVQKFAEEFILIKVELVSQTCVHTSLVRRAAS